MGHRTRLATAATAGLLACLLALSGCGQQPSGSTATGDGSSSSAADDAGSGPDREQDGAPGDPSPGSDPDDGQDGGQDGGSSASSPSTGGSATGTTIPDDFPLSAGMGGAGDTVPTSRTGTGVRDLELCGTSPLRGLGTRDRMVADNSGGESADTRELLVLGSPADADELADQLGDLASGCDQPDASGAMETRTEVLASPFGPRPVTTLLQTYTLDGAPGTGATVVHVVPVGPAVLVTSTYGQWTRDDADAAVAQTVDPLRDTVAALARFGDVPTPAPTPPAQPTPDPGAPPASPVPPDFPLDVGLPEGGDDNDVTPPTQDAAMDPVELCGRTVWPAAGTAGGTDHLHSSVVGPEYYDGRELVVHADAEVASNAMASLRQAARECRRWDNQVWTVLDRDTGYDTVTVGLTYDDGLGSSVYQVTRVGSARLMVQTYGEGSLASLDEQADGVTATTEKIVPAMCVFTKSGC